MSHNVSKVSSPSCCSLILSCQKLLPPSRHRLFHLSTITQHRYTDCHNVYTTSLYFLMISIFRLIFLLDTLARVVNDHIRRHFIGVLSSKAHRKDSHFLLSLILQRPLLFLLYLYLFDLCMRVITGLVLLLRFHHVP
jgi:hypothetical protein